MDRILILSHLGLGDNIFCIAMINFALEHSKVDYICRTHNITNFQQFFDKNPNLSLISVKHHSETPDYINKNKHLYKRILISGCHSGKGTNIKAFPFFQYDDINISRDILKTHFSIPDTHKSEELFESVKSLSYIIVNNKSSSGSIFNVDTELSKYKIDPNNTLIINTQTNYYKKGHKYYSIAETFVFQKLIDYKKTLIHAQKILISDSSMFCLAIQLKLNSRENKVYVRDKSFDWNSLLNFYDKKFSLGN